MDKQTIADLAPQLTEPFKHVVVGQVDEYCAYLTKIKGAYLFHQHAKDEMYMVMDGSLVIEYADGSNIHLSRQETLVVRAGEKHRSVSEDGALVVMFKARDLFAE